MTLIIPPGYGQLVYSWTLAGDPEPMVTTIGVDLRAVGGDFQAYCDAAANAFTTNWPAANQSNAYTYTGARLYVGEDGGPPAVFETIRARVGTNNTGPVPNNCAALIRKFTASAGRRNRGRMYLPPFCFDEASIDGTGTINAGSVVAVQNLIHAWFNEGVTPYVILHSTGNTPPPAPTPITALTLQSKLATQRRRMRK